MLIEREAGLKGLVLRPLSAKLFEPTLPEKEGVVDRDRLLDISGRGRKPQIALAKKFDINNYPCPAGGCLLTDPGFAKRVKDLLQHDMLTLDNVKLIKIGRHFRLSKDTKLIIGRDDAENNILQSYVSKEDISFQLVDKPGPFSVLKGRSDSNLINLAASVIAHHTKFRQEPNLDIDYWHGEGQAHAVVSVEPAQLELIEKLRL
jgi:hypothetical protein